MAKASNHNLRHFSCRMKGKKMFDQRAELFFEDPRNNRQPPNDYGVLYLLRKDVLLCLGWDPVQQIKTSHQAIWPGAMATLAGIDLLAKFYKGNDSSSNVGDRFKKFINKYFQLTNQGDETVIYQLRNSLLHSFGLYSKTTHGNYYFLVTAGEGPLIQQISSDKYQIDLITLHHNFEIALENYRNDLDSDSILQQNFLHMFPYYGAVRIGENL
jgi:hypothetical protein